MLHTELSVLPVIVEQVRPPFKLYLDNEKLGKKTYHVYFKQLAGGKLTLTTGVAGATNLVLNSGTYVAIIYVDENGNISSQGMTATNTNSEGK